jgi:non-canonical (house-cleaning) NTP pyrophosphatase
MERDLRAFWRRFQDGIEIAVASSAADKLLGVRDGFVRYFHQGLGRELPIAVVPQQIGEGQLGLPLSDEETIELARKRAVRLRESFGAAYHFYVAAEGGLHSIELEGKVHYFVRAWSVVLGLAGEAWGASSSVEIPQRLIEGLDDQQVPFAIPGTRRKGGMTASLTGGLESRRAAVATATFNAVSSVLYGIIESHPLRRR